MNNQNMTPEEIANSCEEAAALIDGSWVRGAWAQTGEDGVTRYCIEGALAAALGYDVEEVADGNSDSSWNSRNGLRSCQVYQAIVDTLVIRESKDDRWTQADLDNYVEELSDSGLPHWNDQNERTEQEVLDLLHATAKRVQGVEE